MTIREIIEAVLSGRIRIPAFQRGFVWDADMVAFLMDSIYKRYPIGSLLFWRSKAELKQERQLGPYSLPKRDPDYPIDYVLDGQQRITSIFGVFQTDLQPDNEVEWPHIYFDYAADSDAQDTQFFALKPSEVDSSRHFPLKALFDTVEYRKATKAMSDKQAVKIDEMQSVFKEASIPVETVTTEDKTKIAIIFERVNRQGIPLDTLQLLTAWTWSDQFDLQKEFEDLAEELRPFGFHAVGEDANLLLRSCAAVLVNDVALGRLMEINGSEARAGFARVANGVKGAVDFLRSNLSVHSIDALPFTSLLIPLSVFFAAETGKQVNCNDQQRREIERWFWRTCFSRRYSSGVQRNLNYDISQILKLKKGESHNLGAFSVNIDSDFFKEQRFRINSVGTKTFVLMLAQKQPRSFIDGQKLDLEDKLAFYNRTQFHHLMPKAFLRRSEQGGDGYENVLANFCFLSRADNQEIGGKKPSEYRKKMPANFDQVIDSALVPNSLFDDKFEPFIDARASLLKDYADQLCENV